MSKDVIERAIKKATGELEGVEYEEIRYEGYAPGGVAVIVDCLTDNKVRTVADVRHAFGKFGGNLGTDGSVAFMFRKLGVLQFAAGADEDAITDAAIEAGADDVVVYPEDGAIDVLTAPDAFADGARRRWKPPASRPAMPKSPMRADNDIAVEGDTAQQVVKLLAWLEDLDDVQDVYSNAELGDGCLRVTRGKPVARDPHPRHRSRFATTGVGIIDVDAGGPDHASCSMRR